MDLRTLLATFALQLLLVAAGAAHSGAGEACAEPGALRSELSGALSVCVAGAERQHAWALLGRNNMAAVSPRTANCTGLSGQLVCAYDCRSVGACIGNNWALILNCSDDLVCVDGECVGITNNQCPSDAYSTVRCLQSGKYPNLRECSQYYTCDASSGVGDGKLKYDCDGYLYDACLGTCSVNATEGCSWKQNSSCVPGTYGVAPHNDRLYYFCVGAGNETTMYWNDCGEKGHFDLNNSSCLRAEEPGCGSCGGSGGGGDTTTTSSTTSTTTTTTTTESTPDIPDPEECSGPGDRLADPNDPCRYYYCLLSGQLDHRKCSPGYSFDPSVRDCVAKEGACPS